MLSTTNRANLLMEQSIRQKLSQQQFRHLPMSLASIDFRRIDAANPDITTIVKILLRLQTGVSIESGGEIEMYNINEFLMTKCTPAFIADLISALGFTHLNDTIDVFYNLLWNINVHPRSMKNILSKDEIAYISGLATGELVELIPANYNGARDKASLLYAAVSGDSVPDKFVNTSYRYHDEVARYPPALVWDIANRRYDIINKNVNLGYTPYETVALHPKDAIERIFLLANTENVDDLITRYGIVFPPTSAYEFDNQEEKLDDFLYLIADYEPVFNRPADIVLPPPPIRQIRDNLRVQYGNNNQLIENEIRRELEQYTFKELIDAYEFPNSKNWFDKFLLIVDYIEESESPMWAWRHRHCQNDNTRNLEENTFHGDMNKDDPNDPTLSYGLPGNYRCYQVAELIYTFNTNEGFTIPDFNANNVGIDPTTGEAYAQEFTTDSIRQLQELLRENPVGNNVRDLQDVITRKLEETSEELARLREMKREYDRFTPEQQYLINLFIAWIFIYGMWMRFWKGPGYEYPYDSHVSDICIPTTRDKHVQLQYIILFSLQESYQRDPVVTRWINSLPMIRYDYNSRIVTPQNETITQTLPGYIAGRSCMGIGGDIFVQTGYVLITRLLGRQGEQLDQFIATMLPPLLDIEREIVNRRLSEEGIEESERLTLIQRRNELNQPLRPQARFDPTRVRPNKHV
jgi:hypothetical protein